MERRPNSLVYALHDLVSTCIAFGDRRGNELKKEGRSVWLVATLGPLGPGVKRDSYGAPRRTAEECRPIRRTSVSSQTKCSRLG